MFNYDSGKFQDRVNARKLAEDLKASDKVEAPSASSFKGFVALFIIIAFVAAYFS